ncbi:hypothetical protein G6F24_008818 [Rhizopus arrhizus]|nr:hypothetical protein G6F24_008818 [Rhizopus arrhizus]
MAVSLSGEDHHDWRQTLFANGVTQCHDKRASSATTYLGYLLTSSGQQLSNYLDSLTRLRTVIFLKQKNFPHVKFQDCQRPRNEGGIAIMDLSTQHSALQIRWHIPLILSSDPAPTPESFDTSFMKYTLCALSTVDEKLTPITSFLSRKQHNRSETYFDLLSLGHVKEENFFAALRSTSDLSPGLIISSLGFPPPEPDFHSLLSSPLPDGTPIENISTKWLRHIDKLPAS